MHCYIAIVFAVLLTGDSSPTKLEQSAPVSGESLGDRLLDDMPADTQNPTVVPPIEKPKAPAVRGRSPNATPATNAFGVGPPPKLQPLTRVQHGMENAEAILANSNGGARASTVRLAGVMQQGVLSDLDKLIAELSKQGQGGQCESGNSPPKPGQNSQPKSGKPGASASQGKSAARDSTDRLDRTTAKAVDKGQVEEIVKALWGQLPERSREQMLQSFSDEFLPKYELEIEQYYRRLSEEEGRSERK